MTTTQAGDIAVRNIEIWAEGDRASFDGLIHPKARNWEDVVGPPAGRELGPAGFYATSRWLRDAFGVVEYEIERVVSDGDIVAVKLVMSGRQVGMFTLYTPDGEVDQVFPNTGKSFATNQTHWFRIEDGLLREHWATRDDMGQAKQLGWLPPTPDYLARQARAKAELGR
jgi:predicted ester cyclase